MKINEVKYEKTFNLGNHSTETIGVSLSPSENESPESLFIAAKKMVHGDFSSIKAINGVDNPVLSNTAKDSTDSSNTEEHGEAQAAPEKEEKAPKARKAKQTSAPKEEPLPEKEVETSATIEEETPIDPPAPKEAARAARVKKAKTTVYDREKAAHKELFIKCLTEKDSAWSKRAPEAKAASIALAGKDFLDEEGMILESFKAELEEYFPAATDL